MVAQPYGALVDVLVLGPLKVNVDGVTVELAGAKERTLLAHLVAHAGQVVPVADLIDSLWGEDPPRSAAKALQTYVLRLRNRLEPDRPGGASLIVTDGPGYRVALSPLETDAGRFAELCRLAADALAGGRPEAAVDASRDALQLWRGPAYAGCEHTDFGQAEAVRLGNLRLAAMETRFEANLALDRAASVVPELERHVGEHPLRERAWALLMLAHYRAGGQAEALAAYDRARVVLADELGVDPGPELRDLHARVLAQDPGLLPAGRVVLPEGLRDATPMVGREAELTTLRDAWRRAVAGAPSTVLLRGPAGAGAQRLAAALATDVAHDGGAVVLTGPGSSPPAAPNGRPWLLVADRHVPARPARALLVVLGGDGGQVVDGATVVDLAPLADDAVARIVETYVGPAHVAEVTQAVLANGPGWPGRVHLEAMRLARQAATQRIEVAVDVAGTAHARLASARAEVTEGIVALGEAPHLVLPAGTCPWRGLASYGVDDAPWYAGRERLVAELVAHIGSSRFVALVGASGSGKSSALHAGVLAALADDVLPGSAAWGRVVMRPGRHPMKELARRALGSPRADVGDVLSRLLDGGETPARNLLVVDQLEELWTACEDPGERAAYVDTLAELVRDPRSTTTVVVAVRADYLAQAAEHPELTALMADSTVLVGSPTPAEVERAVVRPAARAGLRLEDGLAQTLVTDAGSEPGLLPLLSVALTQLWEGRDDGMLTYAGYVRTGGIAGAIGRLAEDVWARLSPEEQGTARALLLRLAGPGDAGTVTRRRVQLGELETLSRSGVRRVVDELAQARLLTLDEGHVEVAHEALFREWPRLRGWLTDDAAGRSVRLRLAQAASEWAGEARDPGLLWTGTRLLSAQEVADAHPDEVSTTEREFLAASRATVEAAERDARDRAAATARQNRRLRLLLVVAVAFLALAITAGLLALGARGRAERSADEAERAAVAADARRLAADALNADRPELGLLMAVEAVHREQSPETYGALLTLLTRSPEAVVRFRIPERFLRIATSTDGRTVYLTDNGSTMYAVDTESGVERWHAETPDGTQWGRPVVDPRGQWVAAPVLAADDDAATVVLVVLDPASGATIGGLTWGDLRRVDPEAGGRVDDFAIPLSGRSVFLGTRAAGYVVLPATDAVSHRVRLGDHLPFLGRVTETSVSVPLAGGGADVVDVRNENRQHHDDVAIGAAPDGLTVATGIVTTTATGTTTTTLRIRRTSGWQQVAGPVTVPGEVLEVAWVPGTRLVAVLHDEVVELRDARTLALDRTIDANSGFVMGAGAAGPGMLWIAGRDGTAVALDVLGTQGLLRTIGGGPVLDIGDADAGSRFAVWTQQFDDRPNPARIVGLASGKDLFGELPLPPCSCQPGAVSISDDAVLASGALEEFRPDFSGLVEDRGRVVLWDVASGSIARVVDVPWLPSGAVLSPDHQQLLVVGIRGYGLYDTSTGEPVWTQVASGPTYPEWGRSLGEFAPDGSRVAVLRGDRVTLADAKTGETLATAELSKAEGLRRVIFTPDGSTIVAGSISGRLYFLDTTSLEAVAPERIVTAGFVLDLAVSPDERILAVLGTDGDTTLFDTATWRPYGRPVVDHLGWGLLTFQAERLRVYGQGGPPREISTEPADWLAAACRAANTSFTPEESAVILPGEPVASTCK
jgi:DNA-binding SARP family transcriptional activator